VILEGIVTTLSTDGRVNIAPMGAVIDDAEERAIRRMRLRPYQGTATLANLTRTGEGVFHVTDDVELLARAAVDRLETLPEFVPAQAVEGWVLAEACRWYALRVLKIDASGARAGVDAEVVDCARLRDFFGLNRAKHAVVEAAILATRVRLLPPAEIREELKRLAIPVEKTGGAAEQRAFAFLQDYVEQAFEVGP
jgi:uncharacterized protein